MKSIRGILNSSIVLICLVIILCSCGAEIDSGLEHPANVQTDDSQREKGEANMVLLTKEELFQYLENNNVGLTENDFEGIDIDDFISERIITDSTFRLINWETIFEAYQLSKDIQRRHSIMAREKISVEYTAGDYEAFVKSYFSAIDGKVDDLGNVQGLNAYRIITESGSSNIWIGKTINIDEYDIRNSGYHDTLEIYIPNGDMALRAPFCYSDDGKYFLIVVTNDTSEYSYWLSELFTKTSYPLEAKD